MKNYPHLYTPVNKKASFSGQIKSHKKTPSINGPSPSYTKGHPSHIIPTINKSINPYGTSIRRSTNQRISSRSIEEIHHSKGSEDSTYDMQERKQMLLEDHRQMNFGQYALNTLNNNYSSMNGHYPQGNRATHYPNSSTLNNQYASNTQANYNQPHYQTNYQSAQGQQLFEKSYKKIGQIKYQVDNKNIDHQLNEVLQLIKQEKYKANQTLKTLKKTADHYKRICEVAKGFIQVATNTQDQLNFFKQTHSNDTSTQYQQLQSQIENSRISPSFAQKQQRNYHNFRAKSQSSDKPNDQSANKQKTQSPDKLKTQSTNKQKSQLGNKQNSLDKQGSEIDGKQIQIYTKLATMLEDMNISSKQILPEDIQLNFEVKNYKTLSDAQIIKIQKFFIKKLVQKIPK